MRTIYTFFLLFLFGTAKLLAWGEGHIVHIDLVLDYLPTEISTFLKSETVLPAQKWGKFPDGMKKHIVQKDVVNTIGKAEAEFIDSFARSQYFWHHDNAKCMAFLLLAKAFRENNPKSASFYLGVLMHSIADMSALNHGPLLQYLTFYQYNPKAFPNVNLDINVYKESPEIRKRTKEILSDFIPDRSQKNFSDVIARLYTQSAFDSAYLSKIENKIAIEGLKKILEQGKVIASICASPAVVLASHGLIQGRKATCYPAKDFVDALGESYTGEDVQVDGNLITANGPKSAMAFSLVICEKLGVNAKF